MPHNVTVDFYRASATVRRPHARTRQARINQARTYQARTDQTEPQAPRADYMKLVILLAMIFLPWVAIAFVARLGFAGH